MSAVIEYINAAVAELHQVRWPTRQQAVRLSVIVFVFCAISSIFFGGIDFGMSWVIQQILSNTI